MLHKIKSFAKCGTFRESFADISQFLVIRTWYERMLAWFVGRAEDLNFENKKRAGTQSRKSPT
jgi:hypothetical protein